MKKVVAFLLALIIFVAPVTTLVKADVVIGDNDNTIVNENATTLGRKLAMLESLSDLALSGVTEFTISNASDVDTYLDSLWGEINDAIDYLNSGEWVGDIPDKIASKYLSNLVAYRDIVNNRGEFLGFDLQNPTTSLLSTYFADSIYGKKEYKKYDLALDAFRALSDIRGGGNDPEPLPDFSFLNNTVDFIWYNTNLNAIASNKAMYYNRIYGYPSQFSFVATAERNDFELTSLIPTTIGSIYILDNGNTINVSYSNFLLGIKASDGNAWTRSISPYGLSGDYLSISSVGYWQNSQSITTRSFRTTFDSLSVCCNYIYDNFRHVNIYYNNEPWVLVSEPSQSAPTLDIDGFMKLFGNNNPVQYEVEKGTKIDYDQLYQVIYNAIRDNLPISQGDINYYDSHDTIYSPTIINNYGDDEGEESDLIDTILDYAVIPKFDTAIAQPMRSALTNGVVIMHNSITNVIPDEILLILGACFFLLLFAVVINRMIK